MSQSIRQTELFAGESWEILYKAFSRINFNSYDPRTISSALIEYIQTNYPEDFNDWIESSEFVATVDLLSWLAGSLAFRTDVNARENFLEVAEAKESVLRLARFLSYNPKRAQPARGLLRIKEIKTSESVVDSLGRILDNRVIKWNDPDNRDWFEQFVTILNAAMPSTNPFGIPLKNEVVGSTRTHLYALRTPRNDKCVYSFDASVNGYKDRFELTNLDFNRVGFSERAPNPNNQFHFSYRSDGRGNGSPRTGFFMFFKQGHLRNKLFNIETFMENRTLEITDSNISENDVWVQSISDQSYVLEEWNKVSGIFSENITYNNYDPNVRPIYSVITRDDKNVTIRFADGRFGKVPTGLMRTWYRTVNGRQYSIKTQEMTNVTVRVPYTDASGRKQELTLRLELTESLANATTAETMEQIKNRAPQVYATQNRMVSGEDYNAFPLNSNDIVKMSAVNRIYSGHSRYLDIHDPTATYQNVDVFSKDGSLYLDNKDKQYTQVSVESNFTSEQIINKKIQPMISHTSVKNFFLNYFISNLGELDLKFSSDSFVWRATKTDSTYSVGHFKGDQPPFDEECSGLGHPFILSTMEERLQLMKYLGANAKLRFEWVEHGDVVTKWVKVTSVMLNLGDDVCRFSHSLINPNGEPLTIDESIPDGAILRAIVPAYRDTIDHREMLRDDLGIYSEFYRIDQYVSKKLPFLLWYVPDEISQLAYLPIRLVGRWIVTDVDKKPLEANSIKVISASYTDGLFWSIESEVGLRYIFESTKAVRWSGKKDEKEGFMSGSKKKDLVNIIWPKYQPNGVQVDEITFDILDNVYDEDGNPDSRRVVVIPSDFDNDGVIDIPDSFDYVVGDDDYALFKVGVSGFESEKHIMDNAVIHKDVPTYNAGDVLFSLKDKKFYEWNSDTNKYVLEKTGKYAAIKGKMNLRFNWEHFAGIDYRIDPAVTNVMDIFVLTKEYDMLTRNWIANGLKDGDEPTPPTSLDLQNRYSDLENYKMATDQIIWRPVLYKYIFGSNARPELRAQLKVIKLPSSTMSDGEIKSKIINIVNEYFDVNKWQFGETFYFTELSAFIHINMATVLSSVVLVPNTVNGKFGQLYEIRCEPNEMFVSSLGVEDVIIIDNNTSTNLRIH